MKTLVITSILALGVAGSAFAADTSGLTLAQQTEVMLKASEDSANDRKTYFGNERINFSSKDIHNERAAEIFALLAAESKENE
ncbi:hypothetical protein AIOL_004515 [Candidatus Rhodobacter oscarellae]|uniref:Uncharacterized protein n=1 Tax=Candidatus Rhodobacter oscarellae TaxID=1675527 RepID=A0A0J9H1A8_9RHOB|nr:hypothetical protein [Candidatus Rhodobacter lobularis]KMW59533.1 hypothetical protein AIOL_004515 [Candidatus Rhodobacter lobularis]